MRRIQDAAPTDPTSVAQNAPAWTLVFCAWLIATASTLGALFFGEVMKRPPCSLCWYQRIFMFPMALVLPFGLLTDANTVNVTATPEYFVNGKPMLSFGYEQLLQLVTEALAQSNR